MKEYFLRNLYFSFLSILLIFIFTNSYAQKEGYSLVWHDEFDGTTLDTTKWKHRGLGARRGGTVVKDATKLDGNGHLMITTNIIDSSHYYVGAIGTYETFNTTFGYFEARVKFGKKHPWDSFWLQCPTAYQAGPPSTTGAEIDIFEFTGSLHNVVGYDVSHNVFWGDNNGNLKSWGSHSSVINDINDYVTVAVEWTKDWYIFYVNNVFTYITTNGVSGIDEYIILSEEPYNWNDLPDSIRSGATIQDTFLVDYVRVYQKIPTGIIQNNNDIPTTYELKQNYPNPFNPSTVIEYSIPHQLLSLQKKELRDGVFVSLKVYDVLGKEVVTLVDQKQKPGNYKVQFDATDLPSGIYFYRIITSDYSKARKMLLAK